MQKPSPTKIKPEAQQSAAPTKHFEDVWEASESLFDAKDLRVESILNELQAKASLYRVLGKGSFESNELSKTKNLLVGKLIMTLTKLTLAENINSYAALAEAISDYKLLNLEATVNTDTNSNGLDGILNELSDKIGTSPQMSKEMLDKLKSTLDKLTGI